ncbi:hypothetical protein [Ferruginibacter profundus]
MNINLISWLYKNDSEEEILNSGLKIFRANYLDSKATFVKLKKRYPGTAPEIIAAHVQECEKANTYATGLVEMAAAAIETAKKRSLPVNTAFRQQFDAQMKAAFPWVNEYNLSSIYKWACYGLLFDD